MDSGTADAVQSFNLNHHVRRRVLAVSHLPLVLSPRPPILYYLLPNPPAKLKVKWQYDLVRLAGSTQIYNDREDTPALLLQTMLARLSRDNTLLNDLYTTISALLLSTMPPYALAPPHSVKRDPFDDSAPQTARDKDIPASTTLPDRILPHSYNIFCSRHRFSNAGLVPLHSRMT